MVERAFELDIPPFCRRLETSLGNIPFYKCTDGYRFADHLLQTADEESVTGFFGDPDQFGDRFGTDREFEGFRTRAMRVLEELRACIITEEDMTAWLTFRKDVGTVATYHGILESFHEDVTCLFFTERVLGEADGSETDMEVFDAPGAKVLRYGDRVCCTDMGEIWKRETRERRGGKEKVLNRNNPFSDISIKEQQFIYGSDMGEFEAIGLTTSHTMTRIDKDTEKSYLVLQPGFKIKKSGTVTESKKQDVLFDDTITTEITSNDDNVYVYID